MREWKLQCKFLFAQTCSHFSFCTVLMSWHVLWLPTVTYDCSFLHLFISLAKHPTDIKRFKTLSTACSIAALLNYKWYFPTTTTIRTNFKFSAILTMCTQPHSLPPLFLFFFMTLRVWNFIGWRLERSHRFQWQCDSRTSLLYRHMRAIAPSYCCFHCRAT